MKSTVLNLACVIFLSLVDPLGNSNSGISNKESFVCPDSSQPPELLSGPSYARTKCNGFVYHRILFVQTKLNVGAPNGVCDTLTTLYIYPIFFGIDDTASQTKLNNFFVKLVDTTDISSPYPLGDCERTISVQHLTDSLSDPDEEYFHRVDVTFVGGGILSYTYETFFRGGLHPSGDYEAATINVSDQSVISLDQLFCRGYNRVLSLAVVSQHYPSNPEEKYYCNLWLIESNKQNTGEGFILTDTSAFMVRDGRDLLGGENTRGFRDICISYSALKKVILPDGPLGGFLRPKE